MTMQPTEPITDPIGGSLPITQPPAPVETPPATPATVPVSTPATVPDVPPAPSGEPTEPIEQEMTEEEWAKLSKEEQDRIIAEAEEHEHLDIVWSSAVQTDPICLYGILLVLPDMLPK